MIISDRPSRASRAKGRAFGWLSLVRAQGHSDVASVFKKRRFPAFRVVLATASGRACVAGLTSSAALAPRTAGSKSTGISWSHFRSFICFVLSLVPY